MVGCVVAKWQGLAISGWRAWLPQDGFRFADLGQALGKFQIRDENQWHSVELLYYTVEIK